MLTRLRIHAALALVAGGALALEGFAPPAADASDPAATIAIRTFQFAPDTLRVSAGSPVAWTDEDETEHTVTGGTPEHRDARLGGVLARKGSRYETTLREPGTYPYFCDRHQFMRGVVIVTR